jgi:tripartite-type tricarboxylate transporter receptor subunit TctC
VNVRLASGQSGHHLHPHRNCCSLHVFRAAGRTCRSPLHCKGSVGAYGGRAIVAPAYSLAAAIGASRAHALHIPYRGASAAITDLIGGQLQVIFETMPPAIGYIRAGQLRALAVTTATRSEALPDVPTVASFVPGYEASASYGIGVPKDTPAEIIRRLNSEINAALADPRMKARFAELGGAVLPGTSVEFGRLMAEETEKWAKVMKIAGGSPD